MVYSFEYTAIPQAPSEPFPQGYTAYRPAMVLQLVEPTSGADINCFGIADSGADYCVFPLSFAQALGLDPLTLKSQMTQGVGNTGNLTYFAKIEIRIALQGRLHLSFVTDVGFTEGMEALGIGLLGQMGLFENFHITFNHTDKIFHLDDKT